MSKIDEVEILIEELPDLTKEEMQRTIKLLLISTNELSNKVNNLTILVNELFAERILKNEKQD